MASSATPQAAHSTPPPQDRRPCDRIPEATSQLKRSAQPRSHSRRLERSRMRPRRDGGPLADRRRVLQILDAALGTREISAPHWPFLIVLDGGQFSARCRFCRWISSPSQALLEVRSKGEGHACSNLTRAIGPARSRDRPPAPGAPLQLARLPGAGGGDGGVCAAEPAGREPTRLLRRAHLPGLHGPGDGAGCPLRRPAARPPGPGRQRSRWEADPARAAPQEGGDLLTCGSVRARHGQPTPGQERPAPPS
jgi:hypothetical protein